MTFTATLMVYERTVCFVSDIWLSEKASCISGSFLISIDEQSVTWHKPVQACNDFIIQVTDAARSQWLQNP